jgi:hypothetical protein
MSIASNGKPTDVVVSWRSGRVHCFSLIAQQGYRVQLLNGNDSAPYRRIIDSGNLLR